MQDVPPDDTAAAVGRTIYIGSGPIIQGLDNAAALASRGHYRDALREINLAIARAEELAKHAVTAWVEASGNDGSRG